MVYAQVQPITGQELDTIGRSVGLRFSGMPIASLFTGPGGRPGLIAIMFVIAGMLLLIYLLSGGYTLMTSGGDPKKMQGGKQTITNALLGFFVVFVSYWIVQLVGLIFGLTAITSLFG